MKLHIPMVKFNYVLVSKIPQGVNNPAFKKLLKEATIDKWLGDFILDRKPESGIVFYLGTAMVGFTIPKLESNGMWRAGAIYVTPKSRGKGVASSYLKAFFQDKKAYAKIDVTNEASIAAYVSAGFEPSGERKIYPDGDTLEVYKKLTIK